MSENKLSIKDSVSGYLRKLHTSVVWTHKIQEKESDRCRHIDSILKALSIGTLAVSASGLFSIIFLDSLALKIVSTVLSFISLLVSIVTLSCDYKTATNQHKESALDFLQLRNDIEACLSDIDIDRYNDDALLDKKDALEAKYTVLCKNSLSASEIAVKRAKKALCIKMDNSYSEEEIDSFLPEHIRKKK